jgi:hypothetical protein
MAILSLLPIKIGQVGVQPNIYKMTSTDTLSAILTPGYLQQYQSGNFYVNNDVIESIYLFGTPTSANGDFTISVNAITGVITLSAQTPAGLGTAATKAASNNANPSVSSVAVAPYAPVSGTVATFIDGAGTIGYNPNNLTAKFSTFSTSSTIVPITDANCTSMSIVLATIVNSANVSYILKIAPIAGSFSIMFNTSPGPSTIMYMIVNPQ